jgi:hypothetical protein
MAIEIVPKEISGPSPLQKILLYFAVFFLVISLLTYLLLNFYFLKKANKELQKLEESLDSAKTQNRKELEARMLVYQDKLEDFAYLFSNHKKSSNVFDLIEDITHPQVFFSELDLNSKERQVKLIGQSDSFQVLGEQLLILRNTEFIQNLNLLEVEIGKEGKVEFTFNLSFSPVLFK